uniref:Protein-tyrosine-phosphatase n=1 Tax=Heterorhabditis bacteriophora TaxID=37862 RepID=A0A1I7XIE9_HETBA
MGVPNLIEEFRSMSKWKPEEMTINAFCQNKEKNRYVDVPCQDQHRVIVQWAGLTSDYIHANFVSTPKSTTRFICTQGPLEGTQHSFWAMIIQEKTESIIMLCNIVESGKIKCQQYWPYENGEMMLFGKDEGEIKVTCMEISPMSAIDSFVRVSKLKVDFKQNGENYNRYILHYQWKNWPDRGVPPTRLTALNLLSEVCGSSKPIVVHCSAGVGRTGTIVAIAYVQEKIQNGLTYVQEDCKGMNYLLRELRSQRPYLVQNELQYLYVHFVLLAYFLDKSNDAFFHCLDSGEKYTKWCDDYKKATGCE